MMSSLGVSERRVTGSWSGYSFLEKMDALMNFDQLVCWWHTLGLGLQNCDAAEMSVKHLHMKCLLDPEHIQNREKLALTH